MQSNKTHDQQVRIIEGREKTANADKDFDAKGDFSRSDAARRAFQEGRDLDPRQGHTPTDYDDRAIPRGRNQESEHRKPSH